MTGPAIIRLYRGDTFVAAHAENSGGLVTATGRFAHKHGPNCSRTRWGPPKTVSWGLREIRSIDWNVDEAVAA